MAVSRSLTLWRASPTDTPLLSTAADLVRCLSIYSTHAFSLVPTRAVIVVVAFVVVVFVVVVVVIVVCIAPIVNV